MSEFLTYRKQRIQIGTCENLYYATYADLQKVAEDSDPVTISEVGRYMNEKYGFRYRFPFADEQSNLGAYEPFERGFLVKIPRHLLPDDQRIFHRGAVAKTEIGGHTFGVSVSCPATDESTKFIDYENTRFYLCFEIIQQKKINGHLETVVRCPFCGCLTRIEYDMWLLIDKIIQGPDYIFDDQTRENSARALAGYLAEL